MQTEGFTSGFHSHFEALKKERHITNFYAPPEARTGERIRLPEDESHHLARVLRLGEGDVVRVVDGCGMLYVGRVAAIGRDAVVVIEDAIADAGEPAYSLTIAMGLLKSRNRFEVFLEKAVELGVECVVPILTAHSEESRINRRRVDSIVLAATKQCGRSRLMKVEEPRSFESVVSTQGDVFVCHEAVSPTATLLRRLLDRKPTECVVVVGPEGGFSENEVLQCGQSGAEVVSLGVRRLRAETAAIAVASLASAVLGP